MVDLLPTEDQRGIVQALSRYLEAELPARRLLGVTRDPALADDPWRRTAAMGWFGLGLLEKAGGAGLSIVEEMLMFRACGRVLAPPAFLAATLGAKVAAGAGDDTLARAIADGSMRVALGLPTAGGIFAKDAADALVVLDGETADFLLRIEANHATLFPRRHIELGTMCGGFDETVAAHRAQVRGNGISVDGPQFHCHALVLAAANLGGICDAVMEMAADYAKVREQFGRPIGSFQAIKHRCADMAVRSEAVGAQISFAAVALRDGRADAEFQAVAAKLVAGSYAVASAQENIQVHGAIGTTAELSAHLFLKRAHLWDLCFGTSREQRTKLLACASAQPRAA
jgi:alkylation response protein AidB-like acyl-CoA dehydrogenase